MRGERPTAPNTPNPPLGYIDVQLMHMMPVYEGERKVGFSLGGWHTFIIETEYLNMEQLP